MKKNLLIRLAVLALAALMLAGCAPGNDKPQETAAPATQAEETVSPTEAGATEAPTAAPTEAPTAEPTEAPTAEPTAAPTAEPTAEPTAAPTPEPTAEPTAAPTAAPTPVPAPAKPNCAEAVTGYYDGEERKSVIPGFTYLNLFGTRTYYAYPGIETFIPLPGSGSEWVVESDPQHVLLEKKYVEDYLVVRASGSLTGYVKLKNSKTGEKAMLYVIKKAAQDDDRKQTDKNLPYFLYFEKGSYTKFVKETCCLTIYTVDGDGYYTVPYITLSSACGSGVDKTPVGVHTIGKSRERWHSWGGSAYGQYVIGYASGVYIHGPATSGGKVESTMMPDNYGAVGTHCSGGCLRMQTGSAYWIWCNCPDGTKLKIVSNNPLGTRTPVPAAISKSGGKCYDPTDPILLTGKPIS